MSEAVTDASAVLAVLRREPGAEAASAWLSRSCISAVNLIEVATRMIDLGASETDARNLALGLACPVVDVDADLAIRAALLRPATRHLGLSLGDRSCLALAARDELPVLTADREWLELDVGVEVMLIR